MSAVIVLPLWSVPAAVLALCSLAWIPDAREFLRRLRGKR